MAAALSVEPGELTNEGGVTILEEREGNRVRMVRQYDDFTLERSYDTSRLGDVYRLLLETSLSSSPEVAEWPGPRRPAPPKHDKVRLVLREFVLVSLENVGGQTRLGFDICPVGA